MLMMRSGVIVMLNVLLFVSSCDLCKAFLANCPSIFRSPVQSCHASLVLRTNSLFSHKAGAMCMAHTDSHVNHAVVEGMGILNDQEDAKILPAKIKLPAQDLHGFSVLSWNILLPNGSDNWW